MEETTEMTAHMGNLPATHEADSSYRRLRHAPRSLFEPTIVKRAVTDAFRKLDRDWWPGTR